MNPIPSPVKGFKVTDAKRSRRVGVACTSLKELVNKGCAKLELNLKAGEKVVVQLEDGTVIDDEAYFVTLPQNTVLLLLLPDENAITGAEIIYNALRLINASYLRAGEEASNFFTENIKDKMRELASLINGPFHKGVKRSAICCAKSNRTEDPNWFQGLDTNANTKELFLFRRSQDRIRGYFYKSNDDLRKSRLYKENKEARQKIEHAVTNFRKNLAQCAYFGSYFDRKAEPNQTRLCNEDGDFWCTGSWQSSSCSYPTHTINPYYSREARIVFSTWNLDHRIERSRSIVPAILAAACEAVQNESHINWEYFFSLLFTTKNLKLVHIVCHDKSTHGVQCDPDLYTKKPGIEGC